MFDARVIDDLARGLGRLLPPGVADMKEDFEKNVKATVQGALERLDLVTREEFDVQTQVLRRTREKLEVLEQRVAELEASRER